jgi:regulator of sirC expression with transglutaminase-like and TPR domain
MTGSQHERLTELGHHSDDALPLGETALLLSSLTHPGLNLDRYLQHFHILATDVARRYGDLIQSGAGDTAETRVAALKHVIADQYGYDGDKDNYDNLQNADMVCVIDQRKGLPIALAILTLEAGRTQGWDIDGLNFPGHFLLRLGYQGTRLIFDPFNQFTILGAPDLRNLIKLIAGQEAELSSSFYQAASNRDILIRLQNNIKLRQVEAENYDAALETVETMRLFAPDENRLLLDAGVLYARTGRKQDAINVLEDYIKNAQTPEDRYDARQLLQNLRDSLQ